MIKTLKQITQMKAALWVNTFLYYFRRLWLIGKCMPETLYANYKIKNALSIVAVIMRQMIDFFGKPLYLLCFVGIPVLMAASGSPQTGMQEFSIMVQILFFLNGILGSFGDGQIFSVTRDKITFIKYMHMDARSYMQSALALKYIPFFTYYLLWLLAAARFFGATFWQGFLLWLVLLSFRMLGEAAQLAIFAHTGKVIVRNMFYEWIIIGIGLAGAYFPLIWKLNWPFAEMVLHPVSILIFTALGACSLYYITIGYQGYENQFQHAMDINFLLSSLLKTSSGTASAFKEVEIKEKDAEISQTGKEKFTNLKGYSYINALFFARHKRQLVKPMYYRFMSVFILFAITVVFFFADREAAQKLSGNLTTVLPFFVYIMYFMTVADKASRAMFYNCDKDMLRYAYYRQPQTILRNFKIRLFRVSLYDLAIAGALCLAAIGFCLLCGASIFTADLLLFCVAILLLSVLFTAHHLCLYYIFQPYAESLQIKNPFYSAINIGMYVLCFLCLKIEVGGLIFTIAVLVFTVAYIAGALALVYRLAPKSFRIK